MESQYFAQVLGLYFLVMGVGLLLNKKFYMKAAKEFMKSESLVMLGGAVALLFWSFIALKHNVWEGWPMIITIVAWLGVLKGLLYVLFPEGMLGFAKKWMENNMWMIGSLISILLGVCLLYKGFVL